MKTTAEKKPEALKSKPAIRFSTSRNYYFHPDEDFKEDYEWEKNKMLSPGESNSSAKIASR